MKPKIPLVIGLVTVVLALGWQRSAISRTRVANDALRQATAIPTGIASDAAQVTAEEIETLQEANRDLPKLRNEVRRLRDDKRELEKLQAENERLAAVLKTAPKASAQPLSAAEGFVLKQTWSRAGFATPEATLQTFFWAVANKDIATLAECMGGKARESLDQQLRESSDGGAKLVEDGFAPLAKLQGFRIAEKKQISEDTVELLIQATAGGRPLDMRLKLVNGEWKLSH